MPLPPVSLRPLMRTTACGSMEQKTTIIRRLLSSAISPQAASSRPESEAASKTKRVKSSSDGCGAYDEFPLSYPDFLPSPVENRRNPLFTTLVHADMLERRAILDIPEFYVGSVLAITMSDPNLGDRRNRFVGICITRHKEGLHHQVTLRNVIDGLGVEVMYEIYTPTILQIEVLKLERRLDDDLTYLRDALPEYSTFPLDMEPIPHPVGKPVPINPIKVQLRSPPWTLRWDQKDIKGIEDSWTKQTPWYKRKFIHFTHANYVTKYDVVQHYRDASQQLEHDLETQQRMRQFEAGKKAMLGEAGLRKKILRSVKEAPSRN